MSFFRCFFVFVFLIRVLHCLYRRDIRSGRQGPNTRHATGMHDSSRSNQSQPVSGANRPRLHGAKSSFLLALAKQFEISEWLSIHDQTGQLSLMVSPSCPEVLWLKDIRKQLQRAE